MWNNLIVKGLDALTGNRFFKQQLEEAANGDLDSQLGTANNYLEGISVGKDVEEAIKWFERAAKQGSTQAMVMLGSIYTGSEGLSYADPAKAKEWLIKAADLGDPAAVRILGKS